MPLTASLPELPMLADLLEHLGGVAPERIRFQPLPGRASEDDLARQNERKESLFELIDGVLVEKAVGFYESVLAAVLARFLAQFVDERKLGIVAGADCPVRLAPGLVRMPDVCSIAWARLEGVSWDEPIAPVAPDLVVEVLSPGNTEQEMARKLREYFHAGVRLVWYLDPRLRQATVYTSPDEARAVDEDAVLDGGEVLPGFSLSLGELFAATQRRLQPEG